MVVRPDAGSLRPCPWRQHGAIAIADVEFGSEPAPFAPRTILRRVVRELQTAGLEPILAVELEFHLLRPSACSGLEPYDSMPGALYLPRGRSLDPEGVLDVLVAWCEEMRLPVTLLAREFSPGQYEINLRHTYALEAVDAGFFLKLAVKEAAARAGLVATFMGRPIETLGGSGLHFHASLVRDGSNAFYDPAEQHGLSATARGFIAGCAAHLEGATAFSWRLT